MTAWRQIRDTQPEMFSRARVWSQPCAYVNQVLSSLATEAMEATIPDGSQPAESQTIDEATEAMEATIPDGSQPAESQTIDEDVSIFSQIFPCDVYFPPHIEEPGPVDLTQEADSSTRPPFGTHGWARWPDSLQPVRLEPDTQLQPAAPSQLQPVKVEPQPSAASCSQPVIRRQSIWVQKGGRSEAEYLESQGLPVSQESQPAAASCSQPDFQESQGPPDSQESQEVYVWPDSSDSAEAPESQGPPDSQDSFDPDPDSPLQEPARRKRRLWLTGKLSKCKASGHHASS